VVRAVSRLQFRSTVSKMSRTDSEQGPSSVIHSFVHSADCLTTGPLPLSKRVLNTVRSSASHFSLQYPLVSLRSSSNCLRLLPRLHVTSVLPSIYPLVSLRSYSSCLRLLPRLPVTSLLPCIYHLVSLMSSSSCLRLLPRLPVTTVSPVYILLFPQGHQVAAYVFLLVFPSLMFFRLSIL